MAFHYQSVVPWGHSFEEYERMCIRIDAMYEEVVSQTRQNQAKFVWNNIQSPDEPGKIRMAAMQTFLRDYEQGKAEGRYIVGTLPNLPFERASFDLALCSHFLFLYSDELSLTFHQQSIDAMCAVAREARIFPLLTCNAGAVATCRTAAGKINSSQLQS
jgi:hypothetical protein